MRLYQITEAISLTKLDKPLTDIFNKIIVGSVNRMGDKKYTIDSQDRAEAIRDVSLSNIIPKLDQWFLDTIERNIESLASQLFSKELNTDVTVKFADIKPGGYADGLNIVINNKSTKAIAKSVANSIFDGSLDRLESEADIFDNYFRYCEKYTQDDLDYVGIESDISGVVSTMIHEAVHIAQHSAQYKKGRSQTEYRSYLEKDKNKFYHGVNKMIAQTGDAPTDKEYEAYLASPQEINARSQQAALEFLRASFDAGMSIDEIRQSATIDLRHYMEDRFKKPTDKKLYPIYKRFARQTYQEVIRVLDAKDEEQKNTPK
jgi:hypothetical protein